MLCSKNSGVLYAFTATKHAVKVCAIIERHKLFASRVKHTFNDNADADTIFTCKINARLKNCLPFCEFCACHLDCPG